MAATKRARSEATPPPSSSAAASDTHDGDGDGGGGAEIIRDRSADVLTDAWRVLSEDARSGYRCAVCDIGGVRLFRDFFRGRKRCAWCSIAEALIGEKRMHPHAPGLAALRSRVLMAYICTAAETGTGLLGGLTDSAGQLGDKVPAVPEFDGTDLGADLTTRTYSKRDYAIWLTLQPYPPPAHIEKSIAACEKLTYEEI